METKLICDVQKYISALGYSSCDPLGLYGDSTKMIIKNIQHRTLKATPEGEITKDLVAILESEYKKLRSELKENQFAISGRCVYKDSKNGVNQSTVKIFDSDKYTKDNLLIEVSTDRVGWFDATFDISRAKEKEPDIYFVVYRNGKLIYDNKDQFISNVKPDDPPFIIEVDGQEYSSPALTPDKNIASIQKYLHKEGVLSKHFTGVFDSTTIKAHQDLISRRVKEGHKGDGAYDFPMKLDIRNSKLKSRGLVVRIPPYQNEDIEIKEQWLIVDPDGTIRINYNANTAVSNIHELPVKAELYLTPYDESPMATFQESVEKNQGITWFFGETGEAKSSEISIKIAESDKQIAQKIYVGNVLFWIKPETPSSILKIMDFWGLEEDGKSEIWANLPNLGDNLNIYFDEQFFSSRPTKVKLCFSATQDETQIHINFDDAESEIIPVDSLGLDEKREVTIEGEGIGLITIYVAKGTFVLHDLCHDAVTKRATTISEQGSQNIFTPCQCDDSQSATSPNAYYVDLLGFAVKTFNADSGIEWLEDRLRLPLSTVQLDSRSSEKREFYLTFLNQTLVNFWAERRMMDWRNLSTADIDSIYSLFTHLPSTIHELYEWLWMYTHYRFEEATVDIYKAVYDEYSQYVINEGLYPTVLFDAYTDILFELGTSIKVVQGLNIFQRRKLAESLNLDPADATYLGRTQNSVRFSDLEKGFQLIYKAKFNKAHASYQNIYRQEHYQLKLEELLNALDRGDADAPSDEGEATAVANEYASEQLILAEADLNEQAKVDAESQFKNSKERIEERHLPKISQNLIFISHVDARRNHYGIPVIKSQSELGNYLNIDTSAGICKKITHTGFLIEVLQSIVTSFEQGQEDFPPHEAKLDKPHWAWIKSYGIWHAIQSIYMHSNNFVLPQFREYGNRWGNKGWSYFFQEMVDDLDNKSDLSLSSVQSSLTLFSTRLSDISLVSDTHMVATWRYNYVFFRVNRDSKSFIYYSTIDGLDHWSGWNIIQLDNKNVLSIQEILALDNDIYIFYLLNENSLEFVVLDENGFVNEPQAVAQEAHAVSLNAVVIRPLLEGFSEGLPKARILLFIDTNEIREHTIPTVVLSTGIAGGAIGTVVSGNENDTGNGSHSGFFRSYTTCYIEDGKVSSTTSELLIPSEARLTSVVSLSGCAYAEGIKNRFRSPSLVQQNGKVYFTISLGDEYHINTRQWNDNEVWLSALNSDTKSFLVPDDTWVTIHFDNDRSRRAKLLSTITSSRREQFRFCVGDNVYIFNNNVSEQYSHFAMTFPSAGPISRHYFGGSVSLWGENLYLHAENYLVKIDDSGQNSYNLIEQIFLGISNSLAKLTIPLIPEGVSRYSVGLNPETGDIYTVGIPEEISTSNGRKYLLASQTSAFSKLQVDSLCGDYLMELYFHAPMYIADLLRENEKYRDAQVLLSVVFQPFYSEAEFFEDTEEIGLDVYHSSLVSHCFLYYGFHQNKSQLSDFLNYRSQQDYLNDPFDVHHLASLWLKVYETYTVNNTIENYLDLAESIFARDTTESIPLARELFEDAKRILQLPDMPEPICSEYSSGLRMPGFNWEANNEQDQLSAITGTFCFPPNPRLESFKFRIDSNLEKIRTCRNIYGTKRSLPSYEMAADPTALLESVVAGAEIDSFVPSQPPPLYRYSVLYERAKALTQTAMQYESQFLSYAEKYDATLFDEMKARNDLSLSTQNISLQNLQVNKAGKSASLTKQQLIKTTAIESYYSELVQGGWSKSENDFVNLMITTAAIQQAAALAASVGSYFNPQASSVALSMGIGAKQTSASILQSIAAFDRREREWQHQLDISRIDVEIAEQSIDISETDLEIAKKELYIAQLNAGFARDAVEFLSNTRFTNAYLYRWMRKEINKLYRKQLSMAHVTAKAAQSALAFEIQDNLEIIQHSYENTRRENLLAAEQLNFDIDQLEQFRLSQAERKREITQLFSLVSAMPAEFSIFKKTGVLEFSTPSEFFDRSYPGYYQRIIKSVEVSVFALTDSTNSVSATLTNHGISRVMTGAPFSEYTFVSRLPETVTLSSPVNASGLFELQLDDPKLLPFEGSGVDTTWTLDMPRATNAFDFDTIFDIVLRFRYTAKEDYGYKQKVLERLKKNYSNSIAVSAKTHFSDSWYHFQNPIFSAGNIPYTLILDLQEDSFPPNETNINIKRILIGVSLEEPIDIPIVLQFQPDDGRPEISEDFSLLASEGNYNSSSNFNNRSPFGVWRIKLDTDQQVSRFPEFFGAGAVEEERGQIKIEVDGYKDFVFVIEYSAELRG